MEEIDSDEIALAEALLMDLTEMSSEKSEASLPPIPVSPIEVKPSNVYEEVVRLLDTMYGDNYEIGYDNLYILYPEITIRNSNNQAHVIRNLLVRIPLLITKDYFVLTAHKLEGTRLTLNVAEWSCGYLHSHLRTVSSYTTSINFRDFCLGTSQIKISMTRMQNRCTDIDVLELFLHQLYEYVSWESLEGGPHTKIQDINLGGTLSLGRSEILDGTFELYENIDKLPIELDSSQGFLLVNPTLKLLDAMYKIYNSYPSKIKNFMLKDVQSKSKYGSVEQQSSVLSSNRVPTVYRSFKGRKILFSIVIEQVTYVELETLTINKQVYDVFIKSFTSIINNPLFKVTENNVKQEIQANY